MTGHSDGSYAVQFAEGYDADQIGEPATLEDHIFQWFNDRDPHGMWECIAAFTGRNPAPEMPVENLDA